MQYTPFSTLSDEEYLQHLHTKEDPTDEDNESALRLELLLNAYRDALEKLGSIMDGVDPEKMHPDHRHKYDELMAICQRVPVGQAQLDFH